MYSTLKPAFTTSNPATINPELGRFICSDVFTSTDQGILGSNMFAYCGNEPVNRADVTGCFWDFICDAVSFVVSVVEVVCDLTDAGAWLSLAMDAVDLAIPCFGGLGEAVDAVRAANKVANAADTAHDTAKAIDKVHDTAKAIDNAKTATKVHGNSLATTKETVGYALKKNGIGEIMKFGETTRGTKRYTKKFYMDNEVYMEIMERGTKREMHTWQHNKILEYYDLYGKLPPMNKSFW